MKTRTLLLLAVSCGLAILLAGGIQLFRLSNQETPNPPLAIGQTGTAGDVKVTVDGVDVSATDFVVTITVEGVDDAQGLDGFSLVAPNKRVAPLVVADDPSACSGFTIEQVTCTISFPADALTGTARQLLLIRAEDQVRWKLV
jgi:VCBS repeat-containing protein